VLAASSYMAEPGYATASLPSYAAPSPPTFALPAPSYGVDTQQQGAATAPLTQSAAEFTEVAARDNFAEPASGAATHARDTALEQADDSGSMPAPLERPRNSMPYNPAYDADMRAALAGHGLDQSLAYASTQGAESVPASAPDQERAATVSGGSRRETVIEEGYGEDARSRSRMTRDAGDAPAGGAGGPLLLEYEHDSGADSDPAAASMPSIAAGTVAEQHSLAGANTTDPSAAMPGSVGAQADGDGDDASLLSDNASSVDDDEAEDERWRHETEHADSQDEDAGLSLHESLQHDSDPSASEPAGDGGSGLGPHSNGEAVVAQLATDRGLDGAQGPTGGSQAGPADGHAAAADPAHDSLTAVPDEQAATGDAIDPLAADEDDAEHSGHEQNDTTEAAGATDRVRVDSSPFTAADDGSSILSTGRTGNAASAAGTGSRPAETASDAAAQYRASSPDGEETSSATAAAAADLAMGESTDESSKDAAAGDDLSSRVTARAGSAVPHNSTSEYGQHGDIDETRDTTGVAQRDRTDQGPLGAASAEQSSRDAADARPDGDTSEIDGENPTVATDGLGEGPASRLTAAHAHASRPFPGGFMLASI